MAVVPATWTENLDRVIAKMRKSGMRKVKCGIQKCENVGGMVGKCGMRIVESSL